MRKLLAVVVVLTVGGMQDLQAQGLPLAVEARGGFSIPTGDWNEEENLNTGAGFSVGALFNITPAVAVYGAWERFAFGVDDDGEFGSAEAETVDTGLRAGVEFSIPLGAASATPFVFGGVLYHQLSASVSEGGISFNIEADRALGFEVGGGVEVPLGAVLSFTPGVRYGTHSAAFEFDDAPAPGDDEVTVGRVTIDLGLRFGF